MSEWKEYKLEDIANVQTGPFGSILKEGDIVFSRVGSVDRSSYISIKEDGWMFSGRCLRVRSNEKVYPKFLSYYFNQENFREHIRRIAVGATMPSINTSILSQVKTKRPRSQKLSTFKFIQI